MTYVDNSVYEEDNVLYALCIRVGVTLVLNGGEVTKCCEIGCFKAILPTYILLISIGYPMYTLVLVTFSFADSEKIARTSSRPRLGNATGRPVTASRLCLSILLPCDKNKVAECSRIRLPVFVRVGRIELPSRPWQVRILPLNHTRSGYILTDSWEFGKQTE